MVDKNKNAGFDYFKGAETFHRFYSVQQFKKSWLLCNKSPSFYPVSE